MRIVTALPVTATDKVDKRPLRAEGWNTADPVWLRSDRGLEYESMTRADADRLGEEFAANGRTDLLGI